MYKFAGSRPADADLTKFADSGNIDGGCLAAMRWAVANGIIIGTDESTLEPDSGATRAEIAAMLYRYLHSVNSI